MKFKLFRRDFFKKVFMFTPFISNTSFYRPKEYTLSIRKVKLPYSMTKLDYIKNTSAFYELHKIKKYIEIAKLKNIIISSSIKIEGEYAIHEDLFKNKESISEWRKFIKKNTYIDYTGLEKAGYRPCWNQD